jgi:uncharacterized protein
MTIAVEATNRNPVSFLPGVAEQLGWYIYALRDPRTDAIFYVGKGKGERVYQHARHAQKVVGESAAQLKLDTIRAIHCAGLDVGVEIVRHRIQSEAVAYEVESAVLDALRLVGVALTNIAGGHDRERGWQPLEDIVVRYVAEPVTIAPEHAVVLIRISRQFRYARASEELYEATRKWWVMAPARHNPQFAFSVYDGIVRGVYRILNWEQRLSDGRWAFHGVVDPGMEACYVWKDVSSHLRTGAQNPITYVNC